MLNFTRFNVGGAKIVLNPLTWDIIDTTELIPKISVLFSYLRAILLVSVKIFQVWTDSNEWIEFNLLYRLIFHGKRFSNSFSEGLEPIFSMSVFKYSFASIPLAIAVWRIEKIITEDSAPFDVFENKKYYRATTKYLTSLSA